MKYIKWIIASVLVVALLIFTALFVVNAYNTGKIGHKDEKVAADFVEDINGVWKNTSSGSIASRITYARFDENGKLTVVILGQSVTGTYSDVYDLDAKKHTLTVKGKIYGGVSIERDFDAVLSEDKEKLTLKDNGSSLRLDFVRTEEKEVRTDTFTLPKITTTRPPVTEKTTVAQSLPQDSENIIGRWDSKLSSMSGYEFVDGSNVKISLVGVTTDGTYSLTTNENGQKELKINYVTIAGVSVSNTYFMTIEGNEMTLVQKGAESVSVTYVKK